ncbi:hypothetical protein PF005_g2590 [Phytophthora fragariae]|uniref:DDE Tnp4 domain-containing protein n=2 Tax=Phytophthora fragariae TaxID=53985 RepID=A0A6A3FM02_9STRA|nr:hypothetical protein PF009_g3388 [Phytophthora fragariae]KAE9153690.1 hypothetical protein PF006_g2213 [Phytophthora fragariae]KAE9232783.1 hypothetical protein PF005_g2590 [Phytophthora fragariae]KAE9325870.1 hypothetical protein PF001_g2719 [Phytophthora fragariae]
MDVEDSEEMDMEDSVDMNMEVSVDTDIEDSVDMGMEDSMDVDIEDTLINGIELLEEVATASDILSNLDEEEMIMLFLPVIMVYNYHLSSTRILVECVFGKWKARFKVIHGVTDRWTHKRNARMICADAVLHNLLLTLATISSSNLFVLMNRDKKR